MDNTEQQIRKALEKDPIDLEAASVLADHMQSALGQPYGEAVQFLVQAIGEFRKLSKEEMIAAAEAHSDASVKATFGYPRGDEEETAKKYVSWRAEEWKRIGDYMVRAIRTSNREGMLKSINTAKGYLERVLAAAGGKGMQNGFLFGNPHIEKTKEWIDRASVSAKKKSPDEKPKKSMKAALVDALRKKFRNGEFTGKQAAQTHYEVQIAAGKNPGSASAARGMADYHYSTRPILWQVADGSEGTNNAPSPGQQAGRGTISDLWVLKPDAEKIAASRTPKMTEVFQFV